VGPKNKKDKGEKHVGYSSSEEEEEKGNCFVGLVQEIPS